MKVFDFEDYRKYISARLAAMPFQGRGELSKIAKELGVNSSFLSQVLNGAKNFSLEQIYVLGEYLQMNETEIHYLGELVNLERASKKNYKLFLKRRLDRIKNEVRAREGIPPVDQPLDERNQAVFYSSWKFSAVQLLTGIEGFQELERIAERLEIGVSEAKSILEFLVGCGLCVTNGEQYQIGARRTHVTESSPLRPRHLLNWRIKAFTDINQNAKDCLFFSAPMRIDEATYFKIVKAVRELIQNTNTLIDQADDQTVACLNIDLFKF